MQIVFLELSLRFVTVLVPTGLRFGAKTGPKSSKKAIQNEVRILTDFLTDFGLQNGPKWVSFSSGRPPFWLHDRSPGLVCGLWAPFCAWSGDSGVTFRTLGPILDPMLRFGERFGTLFW